MVHVQTSTAVAEASTEMRGVTPRALHLFPDVVRPLLRPLLPLILPMLERAHAFETERAQRAPAGGLLYRLAARLVSARAHTFIGRGHAGVLDESTHERCASLTIVLRGGYWEVLELDRPEVPSLLAWRETFLIHLAETALQATGMPSAADLELARWLNIEWRERGSIVAQPGLTHKVVPLGLVATSIVLMGPSRRTDQEDRASRVGQRSAAVAPVQPLTSDNSKRDYIRRSAYLTRGEAT